MSLARNRDHGFGVATIMMCAGDGLVGPLLRTIVVDDRLDTPVATEMARLSREVTRCVWGWGRSSSTIAWPTHGDGRRTRFDRWGSRCSCSRWVPSRRRARRTETRRDYANLGIAYFIAMIGVELALVILAAPAATAGAICIDRARGTLAHMLMTDLSDTEIVLGKLAARLLPVFGLVACTWPVMAISSLLGGIDPIALTLAFAIILAVAVLGCATALALSVWARKSHEVILATYTVFILGLLLWPIWYFLSMTKWTGPPAHWALLPNPFYVAFAPYADPGKLQLWDYLGFFGVALSVSTLLTLLAIWRTRPVARRGSAETRKGLGIGPLGRVSRWLPGPSLDRNPVLWRESHRSRPSRWMTAILTLLMGTTGALCIVGAVAFWNNGVEMGPRNATWEIAGVFAYVLHPIFGLLTLAAIAPTSMAEERQRGSLDILAVTTLTTREIVIGKWLGTFRLVALMAICPGLMALAMGTAGSNATLSPGPGLSPDFYRRITVIGRCYGVGVVIATIIAHGGADHECRTGHGCLDQAPEPGDCHERRLVRPGHCGLADCYVDPVQTGAGPAPCWPQPRRDLRLVRQPLNQSDLWICGRGSLVRHVLGRRGLCLRNGTTLANRLDIRRLLRPNS